MQVIHLLFFMERNFFFLFFRYLFALQIKRDLASGELLCNENTAALLASYIVQSDCGDFSSEDYPDHTYLSSAHFIPNQNTDFQQKVMENHSKIMCVYLTLFNFLSLPAHNCYIFIIFFSLK